MGKRMEWRGGWRRACGRRGGGEAGSGREKGERPGLDVEESHALGSFLDLVDGNLVDLALDADEVDDLAVGVAEGGDKELVPEGRAVGLVVEEADGGVDAVGDALADDVDHLGIGPGPLEEAAVAADDLLDPVAGEVEEALRGVDDGVVGEGGVGDGEVALGGLEGHHQSKIGLHELLRRADGRRGRLGAEEQRLFRRARLEDVVGGLGTAVADGPSQLFVLAPEFLDLLEEGLEEELLPDARPLGVLPIPLAPLDALLVGQALRLDRPPPLPPVRPASAFLQAPGQRRLVVLLLLQPVVPPRQTPRGPPVRARVRLHLARPRGRLLRHHAHRLLRLHRRLTRSRGRQGRRILLERDQPLARHETVVEDLVQIHLRDVVDRLAHRSEHWGGRRRHPPPRVTFSISRRTISHPLSL
mmetsp:Transcript_6625/g.20142  ORF Transcript_6625/g.20142 Transcript_6625/m.20142 type:complete len:415 (-) Transcript_6625:14-1258(-)